METVNIEDDSKRLDTTLGDLIHAIGEAAKESDVEEKDLAPVTMQILEKLLSK